jgi:hypothetical protein
MNVGMIRRSATWISDASVIVGVLGAVSLPVLLFLAGCTPANQQRLSAWANADSIEGRHSLLVTLTNRGPSMITIKRRQLPWANQFNVQYRASIQGDVRDSGSNLMRFYPITDPDMTGIAQIAPGATFSGRVPLEIGPEGTQKVLEKHVIEVDWKFALPYEYDGRTVTQSFRGRCYFPRIPSADK